MTSYSKRRRSRSKSMSKKSLCHKSKEQLLRLARSRGKCNYSGLKKNQLVRCLRSTRKSCKSQKRCKRSKSCRRKSKRRTCYTSPMMGAGVELAASPIGLKGKKGLTSFEFKNAYGQTQYIPIPQSLYSPIGAKGTDDGKSFKKTNAYGQTQWIPLPAGAGRGAAATDTGMVAGIQEYLRDVSQAEEKNDVVEMGKLYREGFAILNTLNSLDVKLENQAALVAMVEAARASLNAKLPTGGSTASAIG